MVELDLIVEEDTCEIDCEIEETIDLGNTVVQPLTVTSNGTYTGGEQDGKRVAYNPVTVDVKPTVKDMIAFRGGASYLFRDAPYEDFTDIIAPDDFSGVTNLKGIFSNCIKAKRIPLINTSSVNNMNSAFDYCIELKEVSFSDTSKVVDFSNTFINCKKLVSLPRLDVSSAVNLTSMFNGCMALKEVPFSNAERANTYNSTFCNCQSLLVIPQLDLRNAKNVYRFNLNCFSLVEIWVKNIGLSLQVGSGTTYGHLIKQECLIHLIKELRNTGSAKTLTMGSANLVKITGDNAVYVKLVTITDEMREQDDLIDEKLPFEVCEATDEGAILIDQYVFLKNWEIQ